MTTDVLVALFSLLSALIAPVVYVLAQPPQASLNMGVAVISGLVAFAVSAVLGTLVVSCFSRSSRG